MLIVGEINQVIYNFTSYNVLFMYNLILFSQRSMVNGQLSIINYQIGVRRSGISQDTSENVRHFGRVHYLIGAIVL